MDEVRLIASRLPLGTSENGLICPFCNGGKHGDRAFSITRRDDGIALFICHRASCGRHGRVHVNGSVQANDGTGRPAGFSPRIYQGESCQLGLPELRVLEERYGLFTPDWKRVNAFIDGTTGRLGIPIPSPYHANRRGVELRNIWPHQTGAKTLHFRELDEQWLGWFTSDTSDYPIVLVEDTISAVKVSRHFITVALLGTHINYDDIMEVSKFNDNIVLCLDRDATEKAYAYRKKFQYLAPNLLVKPLQRDLKYCSDGEINAIIKS